jgi:outer membrane protein assembly factor BamA
MFERSSRFSLLICLLSGLLVSSISSKLAGPAATAYAQSSSGAGARPTPATSYKLISVKVTGSKRFTSEDIAAASGLPVGTVAHEDDFRKAARQLGDSGAFNNITFTYSYSSAGTKLEFQVTDADKFVPVGFTDFVWFSDEELRHKLHERIPLFSGELPTTGRLTDQVSDVLQAMLVEKAVPGVVEFLRNTKGGQIESVDYNVAGVSIRIHHVEFPGASGAELPLLEAAGEKLIDREYSRAYMKSFIEHSILPVYLEHGYLKASSAPAEPKVVKPESSESAEGRQPPTFVDITFPITPGAQYKLTGWKWSGNKAISTDELQPLLHTKVGQPANIVQLENDLRTVQELYGSRGYILAAVKADAEFDHAAGTVAYDLVVTEESIYRMGELEFRGIDNSLTARLRAAWKLRTGDVYDATYLKQYLPEARKLLPPSLDWEVSSHVTAIARDQTVDVDLQYTAKAAQ